MNSGFDRLARAFEPLERLCFGGAMQRAREAFRAELLADPPRRVLLVGEGDGRLAAGLLPHWPQTRALLLDRSPAMLRRARRRLRGLDPAPRALFILADLLRTPLAPSSFDLLVAPYVLDCFDAGQLELAVAALHRASTPEARLLYVDFAVPERGFQRLLAVFWLALLYPSFRLLTGIRARRLEDPRPMLRSLGWVLLGQRQAAGGRFVAELWRRGSPRQP